MQIAGLDVVAVDDGQPAYTRAGQGCGMKAAQRAAPHHYRMRLQQRFLPLFADPRKQNLPRIALALGRIHAPMVTKLLLIAYVIMRMVRPTLAHLACAISILTVFEPSLLAQAQEYEGKPIVTIQFEPKEQPLDASELHDLLPLKQDQPLRLEDVRASIERLFATGRYADVQVDAEPYREGGKDGVIIRFITTNSWFIGSVSAIGHISNPPRAGQLENASGLDLGQPYRDAKLQQATAAQQRLMEANGLFSGRITPSFDYDQRYQQINIKFDIDSGPRAHFTTPVLLGDVKLDPQRIQTATKFRRWLIRTWKPMTETRVRQALDGVRKLYQRENRLEARVSLESMKYDQDRNAAVPTFRIDAGPRIQVNAIGAKISHGQLSRSIPIFEEHAVDNDLLVEGQHNLRDFLQSEGYFEAEVEFKPQRVESDRATIDYLVNTGSRHKLVAIEISGNKYFSTGADSRAHVPAGGFLPAIPARPLQREPAAPRPRFHRESIPVERFPRQ